MILRSRFRAVLVVLAVIIPAVQSKAQVRQWAEDAERGLQHVRDFTSDTYSLIQSSRVGEGDYAFHLANPDFEVNWFEIDQTITVGPDTNLFFLSQLGVTTPEQVARVQVSTDAGITWSDDVYSQNGSGVPGEQSFSLRSIGLSDYSGQEIQLRFLLDFQPPGSAFTQTDVAVGWLIDDIQVATEFDKTLYSVGNPSAQATKYLELINRSRTDALAEAHRQGSNPDLGVQDAVSFFAITPDAIVAQYQWAIDNGCIDRHASPLAFDERLLRMSELHAQDQLLNGFQGHFSSDNPPDPFQPGDDLGLRAARVGYDFTAIGENTFASALSVEHGHAAFEIDWGSTVRPEDPCYNSAFSGQGMQNPAGHRVSIHDANMRQVGIGVAPHPGEGHVVTQNFGSTGSSRFATGVAFQDINANGEYDIGEGLDGVRVDSESSAFYAITSDSGAYALPITEDGLHLITFSPEGVEPHQTAATFENGENVKVDYILSADPPLAGDFNDDGLLDVQDLADLSEAVRDGSDDPTFDLNQDMAIDQLDRIVWVQDLKRTYFGDADLNGQFDSSDLVSVFKAGEYEDREENNSTWATGDFTGDAEFDSADFVLAFKDDGYEAGPRSATAVPEPEFGLSILNIFVYLTAVAYRRSNSARS